MQQQELISKVLESVRLIPNESFTLEFVTKTDPSGKMMVMSMPAVADPLLLQPQLKKILDKIGYDVTEVIVQPPHGSTGVRVDWLALCEDKTWFEIRNATRNEALEFVDAIETNGAVQIRVLGFPLDDWSE